MSGTSSGVKSVMMSGNSRQPKWATKTRVLAASLYLLTLGIAPAAASTLHKKPAVTHHYAAAPHAKPHSVPSKHSTPHTAPATHNHVKPAVTDHVLVHKTAYNGSDYRQYITYYGHNKRYRHVHYASARYWHSGIQCVPYAREVSHIDLSGDAFLWWAEASGRYGRGNAPQEGAVLTFRAIGRMPLGHVAVVTSVIDPRTILVTQANWIRGSITNDVTMQDVSPNNDWSEVEVELGDSSTWGAPYPTYGFIYNRPDTGRVIAANAQGTEVAEAPAATVTSDDAPDRNLQ